MVSNASQKSSSTLEAVHRQFQTWREKRGKGERIPEGLWQAAVSLFPRYTVNQISRALRLDYVCLRDRIYLSGGKRTSKSKEIPQFVELPVSSAVGVAKCRLKVKDKRGSRIHIRLKGADVGPLLEAINGLLYTQS